MTSRERVLAAVNHQPHDHVPVDLGGTFATSMTAKAYDNLRNELGLGVDPIRINEPMQMLGEIEAPMREALGADTIPVWAGGGDLRGWNPWTMPDGTEVLMSKQVELRPRGDGGWDQYQNGKRVMSMPPDGLYFDPVDYPKWRDYDPADLTDEVLRDLEQRSRFCCENTDLAAVLNTPYTIFNGTSPDFLAACLIEKDEVHERLEVWTDHVIECVRLLLDAVKPYVSIMVFSGDAGTQKGPIMGPDVYREMILPHFRRIPEFLHANSDIKFFYHCCGSVYRLMECFVEMGVDILNPLQVSADEMEPERLVSEFGGRIVFWGGGCDTQHVLPQGSEEDVRAEVRDRLAHFAGVPGFVFTQVHNVQPDVPARNVVAMLDEVRKHELHRSPA